MKVYISWSWAMICKKTRHTLPWTTSSKNTFSTLLPVRAIIFKSCVKEMFLLLLNNVETFLCSICCRDPVSFVHILFDWHHVFTTITIPAFSEDIFSFIFLFGYQGNAWPRPSHSLTCWNMSNISVQCSAKLTFSNLQ